MLGENMDTFWNIYSKVLKIIIDTQNLTCGALKHEAKRGSHPCIQRFLSPVNKCVGRSNETINHDVLDLTTSQQMSALVGEVPFDHYP